MAGIDKPYVGNVRGKGLMMMVEYVAEKDTKAKFDPAQKIGPKLEAATRERGIIVRATPDGIAMAPPLTIQKPEIDTVITALADAMGEVFGGL